MEGVSIKPSYKNVTDRNYITNKLLILLQNYEEANYCIIGQCSVCIVIKSAHATEAFSIEYPTVDADAGRHFRSFFFP